jgi:hypothetical protein
MRPPAPIPGPIAVTVTVTVAVAVPIPVPVPVPIPVPIPIPVAVPVPVPVPVAVPKIAVMDIDYTIRILIEQPGCDYVKIAAQHDHVWLVQREPLGYSGIVILAQLQVGDLGAPRAIEVVNIMHERRYVLSLGPLTVGKVVLTTDACDDVEEITTPRIFQHPYESGCTVRAKHGHP